MKMGSSFKKAIFEEHIQEGLVGWARSAKKNKALRKAANGSSSSQGGPKEASQTVQLAQVAGNKESSREDDHNTGEIEPELPLKNQNEKPPGLTQTRLTSKLQ